MKKNIVSIIGIDSFEKKNINQINAIRNAGLVAHVVSTDNYGVSAANLKELGELFLLKRSFFIRIFQIICYFLRYMGKIKHVEIYPGGRFAFIYLFFSKLFFNKVVIVERGDLYYYDQAGLVTRLSQRLCYKYADIVWYREYYPNVDVEEVLRGFGARRIVFIHNAVDFNCLSGIDADTACTSFMDRDIDFLWVNTLKDFRHPDWFVHCLSEEAFSDKKAVLMGVDKGIIGEGADKNHKIVSEAAGPVLQIKERGDPYPFYRRAKYFVLASDLVFLNNALLEAMSYGVVPVISDVVGSELIVDEGADGYVFRNDIEGLMEAMLCAACDSSENWARLSAGAREKVARDFSLEKWNYKYIDMIDSL
ncbi:glycosyltransferase [Castellaniella ginsengisoli]